MLKVNDLFIVKIEDTNIFANGVCHIDNMVVFVEGGIKDELCEIEITRVYPHYAYAICRNVIYKSSARITPSCPLFNTCGGCSFSHITIEEENSIKENYVKSSFLKQGIDVELEKIVCPVSEKYRNKVVLFYDGSLFGYMAQGTNYIVPHNECDLNDGIFDDISKFIAEKITVEPVRAIYLRKSSHQSPQIMLSIILWKDCDINSLINAVKEKFEQIKTILVGISSEKDFVLEKIKLKRMIGDGYIYDTMCGLKFRISPESFYQINHSCAEELYEKAILLADLNSDTVCADLFCGTGTIGIISAKKTGAMVYGVEIVEKAIEDAKFNANLNKIENIHLEAMDAKKFNKRVDVCIIDPPRKGCSDFMIDALNRLLPSKIVYVSCNVDTMVRDIKLLSNNYKISSPVSVFNQFPRTSHVESVVCLERRRK